MRSFVLCIFRRRKKLLTHITFDIWCLYIVFYRWGGWPKMVVILPIDPGTRFSAPNPSFMLWSRKISSRFAAGAWSERPRLWGKRERPSKRVPFFRGTYWKPSSRNALAVTSWSTAALNARLDHHHQTNHLFFRSPLSTRALSKWFISCTLRATIFGL